MTTTLTATKYPILDASGKVKEWLTDGSIAVWQSQEIGTHRPDILTPEHARAPHWAYRKARILTAADVTFYKPVRIVASWNDTPQGNRVARKALDGTIYQDSTREAPGGTFAETFTIEHYTMGSITIRPADEGGTELRYRMAGEETPRLLDVNFRVGILQWSARLDSDEG